MKCEKVKYTKKEAATALNAINKGHKKHKARKEKRFYHCDVCNAWHLTSKK